VSEGWVVVDAGREKRKESACLHMIRDREMAAMN
jgi:hypothetical protein